MTSTVSGRSCGAASARGLGARAVQGGPLTSATADADGAAFAGPAGNFSGSFVKKNTRLQGTYTAPSGTTVPLTLYHHLQKKAGLPKLTSIEPGTIAPGQTQTFTIIGKRFSGDVIPVLEDASLEIVDFEVQGKTLTVTLKAGYTSPDTRSRRSRRGRNAAGRGSGCPS